MRRTLPIAVALVLAAIIVSGRPPAQAQSVTVGHRLSNLISVVATRKYVNEGEGQNGEMRSKTIYTVPADKWFVLTDVQRASVQPLQKLTIAKKVGDNETTVVIADGNPAEFHSATGIAFPPGSQVVDRSQWQAITLIGYLAD